MVVVYSLYQSSLTGFKRVTKKTMYVKLLSHIIVGRLLWSFDLLTLHLWTMVFARKPKTTMWTGDGVIFHVDTPSVVLPRRSSVPFALLGVRGARHHGQHVIGLQWECGCFQWHCDSCGNDDGGKRSIITWKPKTSFHLRKKNTLRFTLIRTIPCPVHNLVQDV